MNGSGGLNTPKIDSAHQIQNPDQSPLICRWPQYTTLTFCLVFASVAIAFPIYYGSLPTLRMKIGILFIMTCIFAVAFVHFTHKHVFIAASMSNPTQSFYSKSDEFQDYQTNNTVTVNNKLANSDSYQENQLL